MTGKVLHNHNYKCTSCNRDLGGSISAKPPRKKDGAKVFYFDCKWCGSRFRAENGVLIVRVIKQEKEGMEKRRKLEHNKPIPGARVFIDGKFIGVAK